MTKEVNVMSKTNKRFGMSAIISHPETKSIEEQLEIFAAAGFESFFLSCDVTDEFEKIPGWSKHAKSSGIEFEAVHAPSAMVDSVWIESENALIYKEKLEGIIGFCSDGEISKIVLHVGTNPNLSPSQRGLDFWRDMENYAKKNGVKICYENANTPKLLEAVVSSSDKFHGFCFDVGHQLCYTPEKDYINLYSNKLIYTHIHDNYANGKDMHLLPKDGVNDWNKYFLSLNNVGYSGTLNLELSCYHMEAYRNMTFKAFVEHSYKRILETAKMG